MSYGYMGYILWVDLSAGTFEDKKIDGKDYESYLTGYGLASKILFENKVYNADPLGPDNVFAIMSGLLTNTGAFFSGRWMVAGKSPLTGGWGDANCGGYFAPAIKKAGYDGIFFSGQSKTPVYLLIDGDHKELVDAGDLWGIKDTNETEDTLIKRHGANFKVACIGRGGENLSRIAGVVTDKGRVAARSGLGAVMGSKKLKAVCLGGNKTTKIFDVINISRVTGNFMNALCDTRNNWKNDIISWAATRPVFSGLVRFLSEHDLLAKIEPPDMDLYGMRRWGTCGTTALSANIGDSPVKNWKGVGYLDFPASMANKISNDSVTDHETQKYGCHHCPLRCGGKMNMPKHIDHYPLPADDKDIKETHKVEYETSCGFGTLLLCDNLAAIVEINDMLDRAGIDTISCAVVVAWAFEAYEKKIITSKDTDGLELIWGHPTAVKNLVQKIIDGEGIGQYLKDGVKCAVEHFNKGAEFAMHVGGQELPMHDPRQKGGTPLGVGYEVEPTPGRHTSTCDACSMYRSDNDPKNKKIQKLKGQLMQLKCVSGNQKEAPDGDMLKDASSMADLVNGLGLCLDAFGLFPTPPPLVEWINGATGWAYDFEHYLTVGRRIKTVRHSFNVMASIKQQETRMPDRARGYKIIDGKEKPVLTKGPNAFRKPNVDGGIKNYYNAMGWDYKSGKPSDNTLDSLGLDYVKEALAGLK